MNIHPQRWFRQSPVLALSLCLFQSLLKPAQAQPLPERIPFSGKVTTTGGLPIGGAAVTVRRLDSETLPVATFWGGKLLTSADGVYNFPEGEEGTYSLVIEAAGYEPLQWTMAWKADSVPYQAKLLRLTPMPLRVVNANGTPLTGAQVYLHLRGEPPGHVIFPSYVADADGKVTAPALVPANYWLHVVVPGKGYAVLPNAIVKENAPELLTVTLRPGGRVRLTAKNSDGRLLGGVALSLNEITSGAASALPGEIAPRGNDGAIYLYSQRRSTLVTRDNDGIVELTDVAPGRYQARLYMPGEANPPSQTIEVKSGETTDASAVYALRKPLPSLNLTVRKADGAPADNREYIVRLQPLVNGNPVPLTNAGPPLPPDIAPSVVALFQGILERRFKTDGEGKVSLYPMRPGDWRVTLVDPAQLDQKVQQQPTGDAKIEEDGGALTLKLKS